MSWDLKLGPYIPVGMYICFLVFEPISQTKSPYLVKKEETSRFATLTVRTVRFARLSEVGIA